MQANNDNAFLPMTALKLYVRLVCLLAACWLFTDGTSAQIIGQPPISGNAASSVEWGCSPCCYVLNKSSRAVRATIMGSGVNVGVNIAPGQRSTFPFANDCIRGGFAIGVAFIEQTSMSSQAAPPASPPRPAPEARKIVINNLCPYAVSVRLEWYSTSDLKDKSKGTYKIPGKTQSYIGRNETAFDPRITLTYSISEDRISVSHGETAKVMAVDPDGDYVTRTDCPSLRGGQAPAPPPLPP